MRGCAATSPPPRSKRSCGAFAVRTSNCESNGRFLAKPRPGSLARATRGLIRLRVHESAPDRLSVLTMYRVVKVSSSGYYPWLNAHLRVAPGPMPCSRRASSRSTTLPGHLPGRRGFRAEPAEEGRGVSGKRIARLMLELGGPSPRPHLSRPPGGDRREGSSPADAEGRGGGSQ